MKSTKRILYHFPLRFYLLIIFISLALFIFTCWNSYPVEVKPTDSLGLISHFTLTYWVGLSIIIINFILLIISYDNKNNILCIISLFMFGLYLFGASAFMFENPINPSAYYPSGEVSILLKTGHIGPIEGNSLLSYRAWPTIHFISAWLMKTCNISLILIIRCAPIIWITIVILITYYIASKLSLSSTQKLILALFILLCSWVPRVSYTPQAIAIIFFLIAFSYIFNIHLNIAESIIFLLVFFTLTITHELTSLILILALVPVSIMFFKVSPIMSGIVFAIVIFGALLMYRVPEAFQQSVNHLIEIPFYDIFRLSQQLSGIDPSIARQVSRYSSIVFGGVYFLTFATSIILLIRKKVEKSYRKTMFICLCAIVGISFVLIVQYGGEIFWRIFWLISIPIGIMIVISIKNKIVLVSVSVILVSLFLPAYGSGFAGYDEVITTDFYGTKFFATRISPKSPYSYIYTHADALVNYHNPIMVNTPREWGTWFFDPDAWKDMSRLNEYSYIILSKGGNYMMEFHQQKDPFHEYVENNTMSGYNLVYSNGELQIFISKDI